MITFLEGQVVSVSEKRLVLDVNHVGFQVGISARDSVNMPPEGETVRIYTYMSVREDAISLFGFLNEDDLEIYKLLITVSGIGPKGGLSILSTMSGDDVRMAVLSDDAKSISKAPGIGAYLRAGGDCIAIRNVGQNPGGAVRLRQDGPGDHAVSVG